MTAGGRTRHPADVWSTVAPAYDRVVAIAGWHRALDSFGAGLWSGRVLEVGCGPGHLAPVLVARGVDYVGLDRSAAMLHRAAAGLGEHGRRLVRADLTALPFRDAAFDVVLATAVLGLLHPQQRRAALREMARVVCGEVWLLEPVHRPGEPARRVRSRVIALASFGPLELDELVAAGLAPEVDGPPVLLGAYSVVRAARTVDRD